MVCTKFDKINVNGIYRYYPVVGDYIFSEQYDKERGNFGFGVPKKIKCKKAIAVLDLNIKIHYDFPTKGTTIALSLFHLFMNSVDNFYPEIICTKLEKGKYLKYQFKYFYTYSYTNIPLVVYEPVDVVSKKEAKKYLACLDLE